MRRLYPDRRPSRFIRKLAAAFVFALILITLCSVALSISNTDRNDLPLAVCDDQLPGERTPLSETPPTRLLDRNATELVQHHSASDENPGCLKNTDMEPLLDAQHLTIVLPLINEDDLVYLPRMLTRLPESFHQLILACPEQILPLTRGGMQGIRVPALIDSVQVRTWRASMSCDLGILHVASTAETPWVLLLNFGAHAIPSLHDVRPTAIPFGPCGFTSQTPNLARVIFQTEYRPASFLIPPFFALTRVLRDVENGGPDKTGLDFWASVGQRISRGATDNGANIGIGGLVQISDPASLYECDTSGERELHEPSQDDGYLIRITAAASESHFNPSPQEKQPHATGHFAVLLPTTGTLVAFAPTLCQLARTGHNFDILLYSQTNSDRASVPRTLDAAGCHLHYNAIPQQNSLSATLERTLSWVKGWDRPPDIFLYAADVRDDPLIKAMLQEYVHTSQMRHVPVIIRIPVADLAHLDWAGTLGLEEWRQWHTPRIEISVITNDRPKSLQRLLSSLDNALYFGDRVSVTIHLEQTADSRTRALADSYRWEHGDVHLRHRVVLGGLLPAVVESWYPHTNNSYAIILEDDIELSPLFYAWAKWCILRYRYGPAQNRTLYLYGISLYQPRNIELRPEGRVPFDPRALFALRGYEHPSTPYLSQTPCSWGAVYFPEHWREFHSYLNVRLSEATRDISDIIVPDLRSNRWAKSWKRFFNELVFLRGYVMLYPNFDDFVSLSTNHFELGSHVQNDSRTAFEKKKRQFEVPLMALPSVDSTARKTKLLDVPHATLPVQEDLPILDLWGRLATQDIILQRGSKRYRQISYCNTNALPYPHDGTSLLCSKPASTSSIKEDTPEV